ncbi:LLM class F420-dependent oxidoreductase [Nocardioides sp. QY071]|uniref:LLM class F420-dependent oxidoreductase n=1 Tax=Nocardioides sp. QY071 TaxID=3044187 RepID=UPI002499BF8C|nr:LLM class F420-dependent oxidoreductase [Nocardioides sp. QY071]WGY00391.1 LLM class F420-dependent oxidoreductase [Nocardioides sp. QY071]
MKLGLGLNYWVARQPEGQQELIEEAEALGFDSVWTGEAWGSDALTPLAWMGSRTSRLRLGTAILQMAARTPTATAMAAMTMDHLTGGRFVLGLGASGPQVVEGWYGAPFPRPLERTREYVEIVRQATRREVVSHQGRHYQLPHPGGTGLGKALRTNIEPVRADIPILLAAEGPKNVALAAEVADGWLPLFYSPYADTAYRESLEAGFALSGEEDKASRFEVVGPVSVIVDDDVEAAADRLRPRLALYIGGMGARGANFHAAVFERMGYGEVCARVQDLFLAGEKDAASAAIPLELVEKVALVGPKAKIAEELPAWTGSLLTTMVVAAAGDRSALRTMAELLA